MKDYSYVFNAHPSYIEKIYSEYKVDPAAVEDGWRLFFEGFDFASSSNGEMAPAGSEESMGNSTKEFGVLSIIHGFRTRGHLLSTTNPIRQRKFRAPHLDLADYGLTDEDLGKVFVAGEEIGLRNATLQQILDKLHLIYAGHIGFEYSYIENRERRMWLRDKIESRDLNSDFGLDTKTKKRILEKLNGAVVFEKFLHTKYIGQKRFSLEGGESTIPALDAIIQSAASDGVEEVVLGMAHRGRLNVLANIMGKTYENIFNEFEGTAVPDLSFGDGDVKYHLGYSSQVTTEDGKIIHLKLAPNPSHLEAVNPVVEGFSRAKADILYASDYDKILPILIHGDASIAGQGVVYETVQMSKLEGYYTGGTVHFVINNQIGFTTNFDDARSATYCTGVASMVQAPVFHVNGDDPEAVIWAVRTAMEYRQKFNNDVFIDMVCYRRHGHNEGDDPKFTQPDLYEKINSHPDPREVYANRLTERGDLDKKIATDLEEKFWNDLQQRLDLVKEKSLPYSYQEPEQAWRKLTKTYDPNDFRKGIATGISKKNIDLILKHLMTLPEGFHPLPKISRLQKSKQALLDEGVVDWAFGELSAYGSILLEGKNVRMSGQDVKRGTFSHRHAVFFDDQTNDEYNRLNTMTNEQGKFMIYNSLLSEFAVLGFEYGYSLSSPDNLVIWEAQFGDFYNGAQTIVDQFISAGESKWQRMSGIVMLLPHGMEGQGPEHSSARLERFLQMCAEFNMVVTNITTPANFFHALRRQLAWPFRKPLINMSPKSLLRHPRCISKIADLTGKTSFQPIIVDEVKKARKIIFCSGKIYYDLEEYKLANNVDDVAIVRVEQLYPLPEAEIEAQIKKHPKAKLLWVQEEPSNMGAWWYLMRYFRNSPLELISRKASASPATGFKKVHDEQQANIVKQAFS
ncbi:MAG TPA: 2-oxoglutarate dehydrogenase E1 component [Saprospiraceae bacterium]|nr:2-oxoglutarate dehydrogenase E1 component [Saprospiraceae bacterium]